MLEITSDRIAHVALENSGLGYFHLILSTGEMKYSRNYSLILTGSEKTGYTNKDFLKYLHPDDFKVRDKAYKIADETGRLHYEARAIWDDGSVHWMLIRGTFLLDSNKARVILSGTLDDITEHVAYRQKIEFGEFNLRTVLELAQVGTFGIELATRKITYSDRIKEWFGMTPDEEITPEKAYGPVIEQDRPRVKAFFQKVSALREGEVADIDFTVSPGNGFKDRVIHSEGRCFYDENGVPVRITGASQDVTTERKIQAALEEQVQARTEELQQVNEELTATNEELFESNKQLTYSNEELAQYAYVASHDLQEPLRKIRMFSDMLQKKPDLTNVNHDLVIKINKSAERMSLLIENLLEFSKLLKSDLLTTTVDLNQVVQDVKNDFELVIEETGATINIGELATIEAISLQMNQLFYNLISNALKFRRPDLKPEINITSTKISNDEASTLVDNLLQSDSYHHICIKDNGIGIEENYTDKIFEVFKRLHRREVYPGSGIGLALCRRIVTNHNGYIYTESKIHEGTTFHILLPVNAVFSLD
ncbi:MAG: PAS domain-containing sensor histidine kinase [Chitinophagaceae bacterium]|nr:MAG: PAS domain-containing sensor histidine kinase [Chitinophagaceae bacterium]